MHVPQKKIELKMGMETPRGKFPFAWLALDNSLLEEETGGVGGENTSKWQTQSWGFKFKPVLGALFL